MTYRPWSAKPEDMPEYFFYGAREIDYCTAVRADVSKQHYSVCPRDWYINAVFDCVRCGKSFTWSVNEQRLYFEVYQLFVDARPSRCPACRALERRCTWLRKSYDAVVKQALSSSDVSLKQQVVEVIDELEVIMRRLPARMTVNRETLLRQIARIRRSK